MNLFISWSGTTGHRIAIAIREFFAGVFPHAIVFLSSTDIEHGEHWPTRLAEQLGNTHFGLICVSPASQRSPWLNFEAGALSKHLSNARVTPILFGMSPSDLKPPLSLYQCATYSRGDMLRVVLSFNSQSNPQEALTTVALAAAFDEHWRALYKTLETLSDEIEGERLLNLLNHEHVEDVHVLMQHRASHGHLLEVALGSSERVLLLSLMPETLVREIEGMVMRGKIAVPKLDLLLLARSIPRDLANAVGSHLKEGNDKVAQIGAAWDHWESLYPSLPQLELRGYASAPMYQGMVVGERWMRLELLPFAVGTSQRPALFLTKEGTPRLFKQFYESMELLWTQNASMR